MEQSELFSDPKVLKVADTMIKGFVQNLYQEGKITDNDIKDQRSALLALQKILDKGATIDIITDHTESLLTKAREYKNTKQLDYSRMFYATFFEHQINELIDLYCIRNKFDTKDKIKMIQAVNLQGKLSWLLKLMNYPAFHKTHLKTITTLADTRNAFVHYKWKPDEELDNQRDSKKELTKTEKEFSEIEKAVKYLKGYASRIKYNGKKGQLNKII